MSIAPTTEPPLLLDAAAVAALLGISTRTAWGWHAAGKLPSPVRVGRCVRWRRDEIAHWVQEGCPPRERWSAIGD